jgi:hypothetical protein
LRVHVHNVHERLHLDPHNHGKLRMRDMHHLLEWVVPVMIVGCAVALALWMAGAIYFDLCGGAKWGRTFAAGWVAGVVILFALWQPLWQPFVVLVGVVAVFIAWWLRQKPRHDRDWDPSVAVLPRALRDGDAITIENVRNFQYRMLDDFSARYENRTYRLLNLRGADIIVMSTGQVGDLIAKYAADLV